MRRRQRVGSWPRRALGRAVAVFLACAGVGGSTPGAASTNLIDNPGFDEDVFGWLPFTTWSQLSWSPEDVLDSPTSGSALIVNTSAEPLASRWHEYVLECFAIDSNLTYQVGAWIWIPSGQATTGSAEMNVLWYSSGACSGVPTLSRTWALRTPGDWEWVDDPALVPPQDARSAQVGMIVFKDQPGGSFSAHFDDVFFAPEPPVEALRAAALAALGLTVLGARARARAAPGRVAVRRGSKFRG